MGNKRNRQVRLLPQGEEANENIDQSTSVEPKRQVRKRAMQGR
jgi:hypothetical protein